MARKYPSIAKDEPRTRLKQAKLKGSSLWWFKWQCMWVMVGKCAMRVAWCKKHGFKSRYAHIS